MTCLQPSTGVFVSFWWMGSPSTDLGPRCAHSSTSATPHKGAQECFRFSGLQNFGFCCCKAQGSPAAGSAPEELPPERSIPCSSCSSTVLANSLSSSWFWRSQLQLWEVLQNELLRGASLDQRVLTLLLMPDFQAKMKPSPRLFLLFFFFFFHVTKSNAHQRCFSAQGTDKDLNLLALNLMDDKHL